MVIFGVLRPTWEKLIRINRSNRVDAYRRRNRNSSGLPYPSGFASVPSHASGLVLFAHGSGSSRFSPRNRFVASALNKAGLATLLFDLLTPEEDEVDRITREHRFNIELVSVSINLCNSVGAPGSRVATL